MTPARVNVFGPVPSRRLGQSLGVNHLPAKTCTYDCIYCQVGITPHRRLRRAPFSSADDACQLVRARLERAENAGEAVDVVSFVPNGEPTLDRGLGDAIDAVKRLGPNVAVITNSSLLGQREVRAHVARADLVSVKLDAGRERTWRRMNRPHPSLHFERIMAGLVRFAREYRGTLTTETMLVAGVNDSRQDLDAIACRLAVLRPAIAFIDVPLRPPAEPWVRIPSRRALLRARDLIAREVADVRLLTEPASGPLPGRGDVVANVLALTRVHPVATDAIDGLLARAGVDPAVLSHLVDAGRLVRVRHCRRAYYRAQAS
jgi:wyosine [tRNA(Phe)-imidazoG37] synthetase (radical SAM superfamily)